MAGLVDSVFESGVAWIRLNDPARRNALGPELAGNLLAVLRAANEDPAIGSILLESEGPVFASGPDPSADGGELCPELYTVSGILRKPLVAAVQGPALNGGVALLANSHIVVASQGASFAVRDLRAGRFPAATYRALAAAIGARRAMEVCLTGRVFTVPEAVAWGLVHQSAPQFEFDDRAREIAESLASAEPGEVAAGLRLLHPFPAAQANDG